MSFTPIELLLRSNNLALNSTPWYFSTEHHHLISITLRLLYFSIVDAYRMPKGGRRWLTL